jgi:hypothetical protein
MRVTLPITGTLVDGQGGDLEDPVRVVELDFGGMGRRGYQYDFVAGTVSVELFTPRHDTETDEEYATRDSNLKAKATALISGKTMVQLRAISGNPALKKKAKGDL